MWVLLINMLLCSRNKSVMISFDEGPSKNIEEAVVAAKNLNIRIVFHLDPFHKKFDKNIVDYIIQNNLEVGLSITEKLSEDEQEIIKTIDKHTEAFVTKTDYHPVLCRLPTVGIITEKAIKIAEEKGYIVTMPNLDSEDDQKTEIWPFLQHALSNQYKNEPNISIVFRDRYTKSIHLLPNVCTLLQQNGYQIVPAYVYVNTNTNLVKMKKHAYKTTSEQDKKRLIVKTTNNGKVVREASIQYSELNKVKVKDLSSKQFASYDELEKAYSDLLNEDEEFKETDSFEVEVVTSENGAMHIMPYDIGVLVFCLWLVNKM